MAAFRSLAGGGGAWPPGEWLVAHSFLFLSLSGGV